VNRVARSPAESSDWPGHHRWSMPEMLDSKQGVDSSTGRFITVVGEGFPRRLLSVRQWAAHCMSGGCLLLIWIMPLPLDISRIVSLLPTRILVDIQRIGDAIPV
jgi:hypothetical protein